jgi:L-ascorbate metabolism protein UlaG (beta-lactamase superfamily)
MGAVQDKLFQPFAPRREHQPRGSRRGAPVTLRWLGTASHVISTATTTVLIDPFVSRPGFVSLAARRLVPDEHAIARWIPEKVDAIACGHSHYDHVMDAPRIAKLRGAKLIGSRSTCLWGRAGGVPDAQLVEVPAAGGTVTVGDVEIELVPSRHGKIALGRVPLPGALTELPLAPSGRFFHYRMGGAYGVLIRAGGLTIYHNGSADLIDAELAGKRADVLLACLAGRKGTERYLPRLVDALSPKLIIPTHHDSFFAPLEDGPRLLPFIDVEGFISEAHVYAKQASVIAMGYTDEVAIFEDARASVIAD